MPVFDMATETCPGPVRILAVCLGNVCRSPAAEALIQRAATASGVAVDVDSAGTSVRRAGRPANRRMRRAAADWDLDLTSRTRQLVPDDLDAFDLVVAMDSHNLAAVTAMQVTHGGRAQVHLLRGFDPAASGHEVPDPFRAPVAFHASVLAGMAPAADGVVEWAAATAAGDVHPPDRHDNAGHGGTGPGGGGGQARDA